MANFVLVPGARLGAWAWADIVPALRTAGHGAYPVTLSGLAEKQGIPAGLKTHVQDIVDEIEHRDLHDVILVGHSYSGIPTGQAAERIGDRLRHAVFVDSDIPINGQSFLDSFPDAGAEIRTLMAANANLWPVPTAAHFEGHGLSEEQIARIVSDSTPHPGASLTESAAMERELGELHATYISCVPVGGEPDEEILGLLPANWRVVTMATGHWPMFSAPGELVRILLDAAGRP